MSRLKYITDLPFSASWISRIGKLILNFGALEFETYLWLVQISEDPERIPEFSKLQFAHRVKKIMKFVKSPAWMFERLLGSF